MSPVLACITLSAIFIQIVTAIIVQNQRLPLPATVAPEMAGWPELIKACWHNRAEQRPKFKDLSSPCNQNLHDDKQD